MANHDKLFIDRDEVARRIGLSLPTIWREQKAGRFPQYNRLSARRVALRADDLEAWLNGKRDWACEAGQ
jgi:prophage regulatory protein